MLMYEINIANPPDVGIGFSCNPLEVGIDMHIGYLINIRIGITVDIITINTLISINF